MAAAVARFGQGSNNVTLTMVDSPRGGGGGGYRGGGNNSFQGGPSGSNDNMISKPGYRFKTSMMQQRDELMMGDGPGRRLRKNVANVRRHVDYIATILNHHEARLWQYSRRQRLCQQPDVLYQNSPLPPVSTRDIPVDCILTKYVRAAMNKVKCPVYTLCWTPEGKRLITGASTGEFTLWNGTAFNFETILQAHDTSIRAMTWSHNEQWLVSADHDGYIKYWQPNMNNVHMYQAHKDDPIRGLSFSPTDLKLASAADDSTAAIWDFARCQQERSLKGHGSEVRCVEWHPQKGLIVTGSRDSQQPVKLWDPKTGQCLATLQDHKSSVLAVEWNKNGNWLLTASRDHLIKLYDIRMMKELRTFRGHKKEVTSVAWHPIHEGLFVSGGGDGSLAYWMVDNDKEVGLLEHAHDQAVWALQFHPLGHVLASGSNDNNTKFWARNRPGDGQEDIFGLVSFAVVGALDKEAKSAAAQALAAARAAQLAREEEERERGVYIPGMGLEEGVVEKMNTEVAIAASQNMNPLSLLPEDLNARKELPGIGAKRTLIKQPPAKKAQRQFERMWNVSKPGGGEGETGGEMGGMDEESGFQRQRGSLLGPPPSTPMPSMLSTGAPRNENLSPSNGGPPPSNSFRGPPPTQQPSPLSRPPTGPPPMGAPPLHPPPSQNQSAMPWLSGPPPGFMSSMPPPPFNAGKDESWKPRPPNQQQNAPQRPPSAQDGASGDVDYRTLGAPPPVATGSQGNSFGGQSSGGDVDLRQQNTWTNNSSFQSPQQQPQLNDPRMRVPNSKPSELMSFSDDVRDPRRRTSGPLNGQNGTGGNQMGNGMGGSPWEGGQPPNTFNQQHHFGGPPPPSNQQQQNRDFGGRGRGFQSGGPRGRGGGFRGRGDGSMGGPGRGGPMRGRGRGRGAPY